MTKVISAFLLFLFALGSRSGAQPGSVSETLPDVIKDSLFGFELIEIPAGTLTKEASITHHAREISIESFYLGKYEVTQGLWKAVMGSYPPEFVFDERRVDFEAMDSAEAAYKREGAKPSLFLGDDLPVEQVSWDAARDFARRLSEVTGHSYRLPTEAEWEYAARAGTETAFANGDISAADFHDCAFDPVLDTMGWYCYNSTGITMSVAHPNKTPNAWGLYDMHGNVMEWCSDWYGEYPPGPVVDPQGLSAGQRMVIRGGYYTAGPATCRSAWRGSNTPTRSLSELGFRLVCAQISR